MGRKKITSMRIDEDLLRKAHELGLNVSKVCENALKEAIERLESPTVIIERRKSPAPASNSKQESSPNNPNSPKSSSNPENMVARGRFELPSAGPKPAMLVRYTTGLPHALDG